MLRFWRDSIHKRLVLVVLSAVSIAMFVVSVSVVGYDQYVSRKALFNEIEVIAELTAQRSSAAMAFNDERTLMSNLKVMFIRTGIEKACIFDLNNDLVVGHSASSAMERCYDNMLFTPKRKLVANNFSVFKPIVVKNRYLGQLQVQVNLKELDNRLLQYLLVLGAIACVAGFIAWVFTQRIQRSLTMPIIELSQNADELTLGGDFSRRFPEQGDDEIGRLVHAFNRLMGSTQQYKTEMQQMVMELREKNTHIEQQVELSEGRNKAIREIFAGASHDLRQPLQAMLIFVGALKEISTEKQIQLLSKLEFAIDNMSQLFHDLLDVSKLEARLEQVKLSPVAIKPLLDRVFHEFDALANDKNLTLRFHVRDYVVESNAVMLERIVRNLLSNAIRYTNQGGLLLDCRLRKGKIFLEVWDTGRGIAKDQLKIIFKQFVQLDKDTIEARQGVGLGLSIVQRLCDLLQHQVEVDSRVGVGTRFRLSIPLYIHQNDVSSQRQLAVKKIDSRPELPSLPSLTIDRHISLMLIDDDNEIRESLKLLLESWGIYVAGFASVAEIKACDGTTVLAGGKPIEIIVSDFQLGAGTTGFDAIKVARQVLKADVPALIVTGTTDESIIASIRASDFQLLRKPVKPAKLRALINHLATAKQ